MKNFIKKHTLTLFFAMLSIGAIAQTASPEELQIEIEDLKATINKNENKIVNLGISIGYRKIWKRDFDNFQEVAISPIDSTLKIRDINGETGYMILSTELTINPFLRSTGIKTRIDEYNKSREDQKLRIVPAAKRLALMGVQRFTFVASLNFAEFQAAQTNFTFNKGIDGGLGLGLKLSENFWIAWTYEVTTNRQLRTYVKGYENKQLVFDGETITEIDHNDNNLFYNKRLSSSNFKFILTL